MIMITMIVGIWRRRRDFTQKVLGNRRLFRCGKKHRGVLGYTIQTMCSVEPLILTGINNVRSGMLFPIQGVTVPRQC